jgi:hypothetical protein
MEQISRKRGGKRTVGHLDLEQRIARLNAEVKKLESVLKLKEYFHKIKFYRGIYVVELRRYFTVKLVDQGFSISEIGRVLGKHHSTIIHLLKDNFDDEVAKIVEQYADEWISKGVYPKSYATTEPSHYHTKGMKTVIKYKLLEL